MLKLNEIKKIKALPEFIKHDPIFNKKEPLNKIFPRLGLKNTSTKIKDGALKINVVDILNSKLECFMDDYSIDTSCDGTDDAPMNNAYHVNIIYKISDILYRNKRLNKKNPLLPKSICDFQGKVFFKKGTSIVDALDKINLILIKNGTVAEDSSLSNLKELGSQENLSVVFSSNNLKGILDIATMSMRGIISCQRWDASHKTALIGSIVDPYAGIIYVTNGEKTKHGTKMLARCVVRIAVDKENEAPFILLEKLYVSDHYNDDEYSDQYGDNEENSYINIFVKFLKKHTKNKFLVKYTEDNDNSYTYIPLTKIVDQLSDEKRSYRDSKLPYEYPSAKVLKKLPIK